MSALTLTADATWTATAACNGRGDIMHPTPHMGGGEANKRRMERLVAQAKAICAVCPHTGIDGPCYARWRDDPNRLDTAGIWAGMTPDELLETPRSTARQRQVDALLSILGSSELSVSQMATRMGTSYSAADKALSRARAAGRVERRRVQLNPGRRAGYLYRRTSSASGRDMNDTPPAGRASTDGRTITTPVPQPQDHE